MEYINGLRTHFAKKYPDYIVVGSIYYGYMDTIYFSVFPKLIKERKLKVPIVFLHEACRFEVWLSGVNRQVQEKYWKLINESDWDRYKLVSQEGKGVDSILEHRLVDKPDSDDLEALTQQIETGTLIFIQNIEDFLSKHKTAAYTSAHTLLAALLPKRRHFQALFFL